MKDDKRPGKFQTFMFFMMFILLFFLVFALGVIVGKGLSSTDFLQIGKSEKKEKPIASSATTKVEDKEVAVAVKVIEKPSAEQVKIPEPKTTATKKIEKKAENPAKLNEKKAPAPVANSNDSEKKGDAPKEENYVTKLDYSKPDFPKTDQGGEYTVQIGSFQNTDAAYNLEKKLGSKGYPSFVIKAVIPNKGTWYRVRVGTFNSKDKAARYAEKLQKTEGLDYAQVTLNK